MRENTLTAREYWDTLFARGQEGEYSRVEMPPADDAVLAAALAHFGDVRGRSVLDLGCGRGASSLFFASRGARVTSVDASAVAVANLRKYCAEHGVHGVHAVLANAGDVESLGQFDFIYGSMILHHVEPFAEFAASLARSLAAGGRGFFYENNARSTLLMWFRDHIVGHFGVPKHGDADESPLSLDEIDELRRFFEVRVSFPEFFFFRLGSAYLLRGRLAGAMRTLDDLCYHVRPLRRYSYRQYVAVGPLASPPA